LIFAGTVTERSTTGTTERLTTSVRPTTVMDTTLTTGYDTSSSRFLWPGFNVPRFLLKVKYIVDVFRSD
jgi:hypothetical protein